MPAEGAIHFPNDALSGQVPAARGLGGVRYRTSGHVRFGMTNGDWRVPNPQLSRAQASISQSVTSATDCWTSPVRAIAAGKFHSGRRFRLALWTGDAVREVREVSKRARRRLPAKTVGQTRSEIGCQNAHIDVKEVS